jgi:hypothetical protein
MTTTTQKKTTTKSKPSVTTEKKDSPIVELPSNPFVFEVFNLAVKQRTNAKKVEVLQKYSHPSIQTLFVWNFDESIISSLPEGEVPYASVGEQNSFSGTITQKIDDAVYKMAELGTNSLGSQDQGRSSIRKEYQKFYNFVRGGNDSLSSLRRETMFINLLQGLHPLEAEILCLVKDKKLETKYKITKEIASQAYPNIQWGGRS